VAERFGARERTRPRLAIHSDAMYGVGVRAEALKGHLDLLLLAVLRDRPAHGYLVARRLQETSGGVFGLAEGTLYPALHRLERRGFVSSETVIVEGRKRRVYALTCEGARALSGEVGEWRQFAAGVSRTIEAMP
jgi:PadR family transcriptional regulator, regulatory protein PadR